MITPAIRYISSFQDATNSSSIPVPTPLMVDGRIWDQRNLNVSTYRSGRVIPQVKTGWSTLTTGAWRYYNDNPASAAVYGRLYNWYAMMGIYDAASLADPSLRDNIAPVDWEVATYGEWITLNNILGKYVSAIALKEAGPAHWGPTNTATNSSYFTALPGGYKLSTNNTSFNRLGTYGYWWPKDTAGYFRLGNDSNALIALGTNTKTLGFSIRLIKQPAVIPGFTTTYPTTITSNSFLGTGGNIPTDYSAGTITERGIVYGTSINPTIANTKIQSGSGLGPYTINITGLSVNTQYFIRAYAISSTEGVLYAPNISVFTLNSTPTVFTNNISQITTNSALSGGSIDNDGGLAITSKGVVWSTSPNPTIALSTKTNSGGGDGDFISDITGLALNTKYYVRAYATNSSSTGYGLDVEFTTLSAPSLNLILNQYYAYHAYSLRKLSDTYDYRCIRVRRTTSSPNTITTTTVDVLFNSYNEIGLDNDIILASGTTTLATTLGEFADGTVDGFTVPSSIFVVTWYDQSGNNKNVTQPTLSAQPRLVNVISNVATLETSGGKAAVRFIATNSQSLRVNDSSVPFNNVSSYVVGNAISSTANTNFFMLNTLQRFYIPLTTTIIYNTSTTRFPVTIPLNTPILYELICGTSTTSAYSNGIQLTPSPVSSVSATNVYIIIGSASFPAVYSDGYVSEVISLVGTPAEESMSVNISDYYGIQRVPSVTTADVNYIEPTGVAIGGGNVIDDFGASVTARGVCWSPTENPTIALSTRTLDGSGIGSFTSNLTLLAAYTTYYARAYATNFATTSYGQQKAFITGQIPVSSFILDLYPTSVHHAYSLRRLRYDYTGFCLKIRRTTASPNPVNTITVDLSFDSNGTISFDSLISNQTGTTTTAANTLGEFAIGSVDGLTAQSVINVVTWYDQSGNDKNPTIATVGNQPRLVRLDSSVATLETSGGKVAVRFISASTNRLQLTDTTANINNMSSYFVGQFVTTAGSQVGYGISGTSTNRFYMPFSNGTNIFAGYGPSAGTITLETGVNTNRRLFELLAPLPGSTTLVQGWANGQAKNTAALSSGASVIIQLGTAGSNHFDGYIQEVIGYQSNTNRLEKETNINAYWQIYTPI